MNISSTLRNSDSFLRTRQVSVYLKFTFIQHILQKNDCDSQNPTNSSLFTLKLQVQYRSVQQFPTTKKKFESRSSFEDS